MTNVALGLVGYYQFIRGYPLGPELMERLEAMEWPEIQVDLKELNWGPVAIVQDFQANPIKYDRVVLIAAVARGSKKGTVSCRRWLGGELEVLAVQDRIFEAVTGIISVDNLLVIGEHFGIWPKEVILIEVELPDDSVGNLVLKELAIDHQAGEVTCIGQHPIAPNEKLIVEKIVEFTKAAVLQGIDGLPDIMPLTVKDLTPLADICHNQLIDDIRHTEPLS